MTDTLISELTITDVDVDLDREVPCQLVLCDNAGRQVGECTNPAHWFLTFQSYGSFTACDRDKNLCMRDRGVWATNGAWAPLTAVRPL